ncbi:MAG: 2,3,4,5-tetrahydropyridine-2,6-dicarboxylate N-succinyltransferase [Bacteroidota bacterium]
MTQLIKIIEKAWIDRTSLQEVSVQAAINSVIDALDQGQQRVVTPTPRGWHVNDWVKKAVLLYFLIRKTEVQEAGPLVFHDKIPLKQDFKAAGVRVVPPAVARYGAFLHRGVVLMAAYVNIGAYVDEGTMVDIGAAVGSCAQLGKRIHVSAGVTIGGVLEPVQATPVIIEDDVFIGARCSIVEGVHVQQEAVIGANVTLTASTRIIDVTQKDRPKEYRGYVPARSVVIPGSLPKQFPAGQYHVPCALIIGQRTQHTDRKISLNNVLRDYAISI